jgi:RNA polymerase sigma factor (sigma-70 family)
MNEQELVERLKRGDEQAFKTIVDTWGDMVYNTVLGFVQNEAEAEDVTQEVFVKVYESVKGFKEEAKFSTWLYRIAVNKAMELLRKKKAKKRFGFMQSLFGENQEVLHDPPDFHHPGIRAEQKENAAELFKAIKVLPENQRVAFTLNKLEGLSYQEVAEVMSLSVSSVESLIHRAKTKLAAQLQDMYKR